MCVCMFYVKLQENPLNLLFSIICSCSCHCTFINITYNTIATILTLICCLCNCWSRLATVCRDVVSLTGTELSVNSAFSHSSSQHMLLCIAAQQQQQQQHALPVNTQLIKHLTKLTLAQVYQTYGINFGNNN